MCERLCGVSCDVGEGLDWSVFVKSNEIVCEARRAPAATDDGSTCIVLSPSTREVVSRAASSRRPHCLQNLESSVVTVPHSGQVEEIFVVVISDGSSTITGAACIVDFVKVDTSASDLVKSNTDGSISGSAVIISGRLSTACSSASGILAKVLDGLSLDCKTVLGCFVSIAGSGVRVDIPVAKSLVSRSNCFCIGCSSVELHVVERASGSGAVVFK